MNKTPNTHPLKFMNDIADEVERENSSINLLLLFEQFKESKQAFIAKTEALKIKLHNPYNPSSFGEWAMHYLIDKARKLRSELQTYTSNFKTREEVKTYINQQYSFMINYQIAHFDTYYKNVQKGKIHGEKLKTGDPLRAGIQIAYNIILDNINKDYASFLGNEKTIQPQQAEDKAKSAKKNSQNIIANPKTFKDLFVRMGWEKYVNALVICEPPLLNKKHEFIGNKKTQRGVVAAWFKDLKSKGVIDQSLNRDEIAQVLCTEIKNYSISGSSVNNRSLLYEKIFEKQLIKLTQ
jgi:hypothetical protein